MSEADPAAAGMTGLEQLHALLASGRKGGITKTLDFSIVEVEEGRAVIAGTPDERVYNPLGSVHGGYAATLLDSACGIAVHSKMAPGQAYTTLELKIAYHKGMSAGTGEVRATGIVVSMGRRVAFAEAKLTDASGRILASATSTLLVI